MRSWLLLSTIAIVGILFAISASNVYIVESRHPPIGDFISLTSGRTHFVRKGNGTPVVLLHGASGNLRDWMVSIFPELSEQHLAIAADRPGHGWSERNMSDAYDPRVQARWLHELLSKLEVSKPVIVGHSWAGSVALSYAIQFPENTGGILFLAGVSHPWPGGVGWEYEAAAIPIIGSLFARTVVAPGFYLRGREAIGDVFQPNSVPTGYLERAGIALYSRPGNFLANAEDLVNLKPIIESMASQYGEIRAPAIILTGDADRIVFTHLHSPPLAKKLQRGQLSVLSGVGHMPHHAREDAVLAAINTLVALRNEDKRELSPKSDLASPGITDLK